MKRSPQVWMQSYILRAWQEGDPERSWRFRIRILKTGEEFGFSDLVSLQSFLQEIFVDRPGNVKPGAERE